MRSRFALAALVASVLVPLACARPEPPGRAIGEVNARLIEAFNRQDAVSVAALYAEDGVVLPPDGPAVAGRPAIQGFFGGLITAGARDLAVQTVDLHPGGDRVIERGSFTLAMRPEGGQASPMSGKYVVIWKKQPDGSWRLSIDIFNFDARPAPVPSDATPPEAARPATPSGP